MSAIVMAGDRGAARAVYGENKIYLEIGGRPLISHVVATLQRVPEVSAVWVVGDSARLAGVLDDERLRDELRKPLHTVEQFENLYENAWPRVAPKTFARAITASSSRSSTKPLINKRPSMEFQVKRKAVWV